LYRPRSNFKVAWYQLKEVAVSHDNWRELAEKATKEQDPEKLMAIVEELTGVLSQREGQQHRNSKA
jgi:hypothetical protein